MTEKGASDFRILLFLASPADMAGTQIRFLETLLQDNGYASDCLTVINLSDDPSKAMEYEILAIPTLIRTLPAPAVRVIGELSDKERVWELIREKYIA